MLASLTKIAPRSKRFGKAALCAAPRSLFPPSLYDITVFYPLIHHVPLSPKLPSSTDNDGYLNDLWKLADPWKSRDEPKYVKGNLQVMVMLANPPYPPNITESHRLMELFRCLRESVTEFSATAGTYAEKEKLQKVAGLNWLKTRIVAHWCLARRDRVISLSALLAIGSPNPDRASALSLNLVLPGEKCDILVRKDSPMTLAPLHNEKEFLSSLNALSLSEEKNALLLESSDDQPFDALFLSRCALDNRPMLVIVDFKQDTELGEKTYAKLVSAAAHARERAQRGLVTLSEVGQAFADARFVFATLSEPPKAKSGENESFDAAHRERVDPTVFFGPMMQLYRSTL